MAEIPVEKKSGKGWLWALLVVIVIALLAWWLLDSDGDVVEYTENETVSEAPLVGDDMAAPEMAGMLAIGDSVDLENVRVTSTLGDNGFTAEVDGRNMIVVFDEMPVPENAVEGRYDINAGSMVSIEGEVRSVDEPLPEDIDVEVPEGMDRYIFADSIEMMDSMETME